MVEDKAAETMRPNASFGQQLASKAQDHLTHESHCGRVHGSSTALLGLPVFSWQHSPQAASRLAKGQREGVQATAHAMPKQTR